MPIARGDWPRLLALFEQALDVVATERIRWVRSLDATEENKEALLGLLQDRQAMETSGFLTALPAVQDLAERGPVAGRLMPGVLVGPWRLVRLLGQGGMSTVWLAERADRQVIRQVALKLPHAGPGQEVLAQRLLRERNILAALEHRNIARLYEVGVTSEGTPYLVMEYVQGDTLVGHADRKQLTIAQRLALFQQVLAAVQYAHGQLVLHRDLKPNNILVGHDGEVKLLDFGIARVLANDQRRTPDGTDLTQNTARLLTPGYASPEQLQGLALGTASDIYSLGVVLYELLCGQRPHAKPGQSMAQLETAMLQDEPRPPSRQPMTASALEARGATASALVRTLRGDLDSIVVKALAISPDRRYPSADVLAADLTRWQSGQPVSVHAPSAAYHLGKFLRRHRWGAVAGIATVASLIAAGGFSAAQAWAARQEAARAAMVRDFLLDLFAESAPDRMGGVELTATQLLEQGRQKAQKRLSAQPRLQAELLAGIGETQLQARDLSGADAALGAAADRFRMLGDPTREAAARLARLRGALDDGRYDRIEAGMRDLEPLVSIIERDRVLRLSWARHKGVRAKLVADRDEAKYLLGRCIDMADVQNPAESDIAFDAHMQLALLLASTGEAQAADEQLRRAGALPAGDKPLAAETRRVELAKNRAEVELIGDRYVSVRQWLPAQIEDCQSSFGIDSPRCGDLSNRRLWALLRIGDIKEAQAGTLQLNRMLEQSTARHKQFETAYLLTRILSAGGVTNRDLRPIAVLEQLVQDNLPDPLPFGDRLPALITLIENRVRANDLAQAGYWLKRAEALSPSSVEEEVSTKMRRLGLARGLVLQAHGRHAEALESMGSYCAKTQTTALGSLLSLNCVNSLVAVGQNEQAEAIARSAVTVVTRSLGEQAPNTIKARELLRDLESMGSHGRLRWDSSRIFLS